MPPTREGEKGKRRHGDFAIALALAHFASRMRWVEYGYRAAGGRSDRASSARDDDVARDWWRSPLGAGLRGGL